MKLFRDKQFSKKIIIAILLVMSFNFISPTVSQAITIGDALFKPISELLCMISDLVIQGLQYYFMGYGDISYETYDTGTTESDTEYYILYSPGMIFSGQVRALDIDFINPDDDYQYKLEKDAEMELVKNLSSQSYNHYYEETETQSSRETAEKNLFDQVAGDPYKFDKDKAEKKDTSMKDWANWVLLLGIEGSANPDLYIWENDNNTYALLVTYTTTSTSTGTPGDLFGAIGGAIAGGMTSESTNIEGTLYKVKTITEKGEVKKSSAKELQSTIATWYKALRAIALVGLLSVLVYVGIRILISSTSQEKAKYKKMIIDWITAICILFVLQYIMVFTLQITDKIIEVLSVNVVGENGQDVLMSDLRNEIEEAKAFSEIFPQLLMYLALVIYTVMFTIQYLKRLVYMAFFTLISPLIALTYPLDKIKDGQAQAFTTWIREYIFNSLLQPMHLLLYCIFVSSASSLVKTNPLYAVVAIGFLLPAEKFFRKMFGFDKANSANQLGAAAGGALIMNAINKMGRSSGKKAAGESSRSGDSGSSSGSTPRYVTAPNDASNNSNVGTSINSNGSLEGGSVAKYAQTSSSPRYNKNNVWTGAKTLAGRYGAKAGKGLGRLAAGAAGAATLGTVGLAAGIATGDFGNALQYGAAGAGAGYMGANGLVDKAGNLAQGIGQGVRGARDTFEESALGTDEHNTRSSIRELSKDSEFNIACERLNINKAALIRQFHDQGITGSSDIKKSVNIMSKTGASAEQVIKAKQAYEKVTKYGIKKQDIKNSLKEKGIKGNQLNATMDIIDML